MRQLNKSILVLCAHNDDQILGAGGTLIKYTKAGCDLTTVILSYGESSHPIQKDQLTKQTRIFEAEECEKFIGGKRIIFIGLKDLNIALEINNTSTRDKIIKVIRETNPGKIFTHSADDNHPDHKAVYNFVNELLKKNIINCEVYTFQVWSIIKLKNRNNPRLVVDVSDTFKQKIRAFKCHKSQKATAISVLWNIYLQAFLNGLKNGVRYAEVFDKIN